MNVRALGILGLFALFACSKSGEGAAPAGSASTSAAAPSPATGDAGLAAGDAGTKGGAAAAAAAPRVFGGTYTLTPASLYIPEARDWGGVKQAKDDPTKQVGEGAIALTIDASGTVSGAIESGPASPAVIEGQLVGDEIRANVRRKTPSDDGLTGTLVAAPGGEGKLLLADATSALVREGKISLKKN